MSDHDKQLPLQGSGSELRTIENTSDSVLASIISAIDRGTDPKDLEIIVGLQERLMAQQSKREFGVAMAAFKAECPEIPKTKQASIVSRSGANFGYKFASLDGISRVIRPHLAKHGLSYRWSNSTLENNQVSVTCIVSHVDGHSEESSVSVTNESSSGASPQQKDGIANTYAMRYSLIQALGLTTCDDDLDGKEVVSSDVITDDQAISIQALILEKGADEAALLRVYGVQRIEDLLVSNFMPAVRMLERKKPK